MIQGGSKALSVLTQPHLFNGSPQYFLKSMNLLAEELQQLGSLVAQRWTLLILLAGGVMRYGKET